VIHPSGRASTPWPLLAAAIPIVLSLILYWPLPSSWFWADDFV
jgi:hypothetical protein